MPLFQLLKCWYDAAAATVLAGRFDNGAGCVNASGYIHYIGFAPTAESLAHRVDLVSTVVESLQLGGAAG